MTRQWLDPSWLRYSDYPPNFLPSGSIAIDQASEDGDCTVKGFYNPTTGEYHIQEVIYNTDERKHMTFDLDSLAIGTSLDMEPYTPPVLKNEFPTLIDNTAREQFFTCPMKFRYSTIGHLQPRRKSIHLHAGGAYAAGLEEMRRAFYERGESAETALALGVEALIKFYGNYEPFEGELKTCERMIGALESYAQEYPLATDYIKPYRFDTNRSAIEFTFAIPLDGMLHPVTEEPLFYSGRFDMLAVRGDVLYVEDDKTTSQLGATWGKQWELNSQFTGYCWAAKQYGLPVAGAIIRGQSILKHTYGHTQAITYRPQWMIDRWYEQLLRDVRRMLQAFEAQQYDYALGAACTAYSGCEFRTLCTSQNPLQWIEGNYSQRHWNPLQKDPEAPVPDAISVPVPTSKGDSK